MRRRPSGAVVHGWKSRDAHSLRVTAPQHGHWWRRRFDVTALKLVDIGKDRPGGVLCSALFAGPGHHHDPRFADIGNTRPVVQRALLAGECV